MTEIITCEGPGPDGEGCETQFEYIPYRGPQYNAPQGGDTFCEECNERALDKAIADAEDLRNGGGPV